MTGGRLAGLTPLSCGQFFGHFGEVYLVKWPKWGDIMAFQFSGMSPHFLVKCYSPWKFPSISLNFLGHHGFWHIPIGPTEYTKLCQVRTPYLSPHNLPRQAPQQKTSWTFLPRLSLVWALGPWPLVKSMKGPKLYPKTGDVLTLAITGNSLSQRASVGRWSKKLIAHSPLIPPKVHSQIPGQAAFNIFIAEASAEAAEGTGLHQISSLDPLTPLLSLPKLLCSRSERILRID